MNALKEKLAELCHRQWAGWMTHLFSKCTTDESGNIVIPKGYVDNLKKQMTTSYADLSEAEKDSDRREADRITKTLGMIY